MLAYYLQPHIVYSAVLHSIFGCKVTLFSCHFFGTPISCHFFVEPNLFFFKKASSYRCSRLDNDTPLPPNSLFWTEHNWPTDQLHHRMTHGGILVFTPRTLLAPLTFSVTPIGVNILTHYHISYVDISAFLPQYHITYHSILVMLTHQLSDLNTRIVITAY